MHCQLRYLFILRSRENEDRNLRRSFKESIEGLYPAAIGEGEVYQDLSDSVSVVPFLRSFICQHLKAVGAMSDPHDAERPIVRIDQRTPNVISIGVIVLDQENVLQSTIS